MAPAVLGAIVLRLLFVREDAGFSSPARVCGDMWTGSLWAQGTSSDAVVRALCAVVPVEVGCVGWEDTSMCVPFVVHQTSIDAAATVVLSSPHMTGHMSAVRCGPVSDRLWKCLDIRMCQLGGCDMQGDVSTLMSYRHSHFMLVGAKEMCSLVNFQVWDVCV